MATIGAFPSDSVGSVQLSPAPAGNSYTQGLFVIPFADQLQEAAPIPAAGLFVWQRSIVDSSGNTLTDARVEVRHAETQAFADIYTDRDGNTPKQNPFLVDSEGFARFYAAAGLYKIIASRAGLVRTFENVLLGVRLEDLPELSGTVAPIIAALLEPTLEELAVTLAAIPDLLRFSVDSAGNGTGLPSGWSSSRTGTGKYRITHNLGTLAYDPKLTVWDTSTDRVGSAMLVAKELNHYDYRVRSIHDVAADTDTQVDHEVTA